MDSFCIVSSESPETMRRLCLSTKFPHQEIRWNYGILRILYINKPHRKIVEQIIKNVWPVLFENKFTGLLWSVCVTTGKKISHAVIKIKTRPKKAAIFKLFVRFRKHRPINSRIFCYFYSVFKYWQLQSETRLF